MCDPVPFSVILIEVLLGVLVFAFSNFVLKRFLKYLQRRLHAEEKGWKERIDQVLYAPLHIILWVLGVTYVVDVLGNRLGFSAGWDYLKLVRNALLAGCLGWLLLRWKQEVQKAYLTKYRIEKSAADPGMINIVGRLSSIVIVVITMMIILQMFGVDIVPLVAFGGIGAAAVGFAGKDVIANFFGGLMLHINRSFTIDDQIIIPEKNLEGIVEEIGWYLTCVRDKARRPVYLPNALFSTVLVINASRMTHRRIEETVALRYQDFKELVGIISAIRAMLASHGSIDAHLPLLVFFTAFGESALNITIDAYTHVTDLGSYMAVKQDILMRIQEVLIAHHAEMPFPTLELHVKE